MSHSDDIETITQALLRGELSLAQIGGFTPKELAGAYIAAVQLIRANRPAKALQVVGMLMTVDPRKASYFQLAGIALQRLRRFDLAEGYYKVAQRLDPTDPLTLMYRGECNVMLGDLVAGRTFLELGIRGGQGRGELQPYVERARTVLSTVQPANT